MSLKNNRSNIIVNKALNDRLNLKVIIITGAQVKLSQSDNILFGYDKC